MGSRTWTEEEDAFLVEASSSFTLPQLAERLDRTVKAVRWECEKLGVKAADGRSTPEARARAREARTTVERTDTEPRCSKCQKMKAYSEFSPDQQSPSGYAWWCRQCQRERAAWRRENVPGLREREKANSDAYRRRKGQQPQIRYRVDDEGRECTACRVYKPWAEFYRQGNPKNGKCKPCWRQHVRKTRYARDFGITLEDYEFLERRQDGRCAYCGEPESVVHFRSGTQYYLSIDHAHDCGRHDPKKACKHCIRGLLCGCCNRMIGIAEMKPQTAAPFADYLARRPLLAPDAPQEVSPA